MIYFIRFYFWLLAILPPGIALGIANAIVEVRSWFKDDASRANWDAFFGKGVGEATRFRRWKVQHRRYVARLMVEVGRAAFKRIEDALYGVELEGEGFLKRACDHGRGVVLLSGHCGAWWFIPMALAARGHQVAAIMRQPNASAVSKQVHEITDRWGVKLVYRGLGAAHTARSTLKRNRVLYVAGDALTSPKSGKWFSFGQGRIQINRGPAVLASRHQSIVLHASCELLPNLKARITIRPIYGIEDFNQGSSPDEISQRWLGVLAHEVEIRPEQWWMWRIQRLSGATAAVEEDKQAGEVSKG